MVGVMWHKFKIWYALYNFWIDVSIQSKFCIQTDYVKLFVCQSKIYLQQGVAWVMWPILNFGTLYISGMVKDRKFIFGTHIYEHNKY